MNDTELDVLHSIKHKLEEANRNAEYLHSRLSDISSQLQTQRFRSRDMYTTLNVIAFVTVVIAVLLAVLIWR
jgi:hypothetical protein